MGNAKKVIIAGGGFGGLAAAKILGRSSGVEVTLLDRRNFHLFQPLLYQVAMAGLSPAEIAVPIRSLLAGFKNTTVLMEGVEAVDLSARALRTDYGQFSYDYLILACGAKHSYFGHEEWENFAPGLKTIEQATEMRRRLLLAFEMAERESDPQIRKEFLTFVVVGGGPTGVELAGAIGEISRFTLSRDFRRIDPGRTRIILIEAGSRILSSFDADLSARATRSLEKLGVQVWTQSRVTQITAEGVEIGKEFLRARTVLWAAGVQCSSLNQKLGTPLDQSGKMKVTSDLSLEGHPEVFVIGDQAHFEDQKGRVLPGLAPVASQQGAHAARMILAEIAAAGVEKRVRIPFRYFDKGQMATIGRSYAVLQWGSLKLDGFIAWLLWLFVHIYYLIGFKNRLFVLIQWGRHYLTYGRGARLIVQKEWRSGRG